MNLKSLLTLLAIFALSALILILYLFALKYYLYWTLWWYDVMLHFLGGFIVAAASLWIQQHFFKNTLSTKNMCLTALFSVIIVGIGWEIFEFFAGMTLVRENWLGDTLLDLLMDILGAMTAYMGMYVLTRKELQK